MRPCSCSLQFPRVEHLKSTRDYLWRLRGNKTHLKDCAATLWCRAMASSQKMQSKLDLYQHCLQACRLQQNVSSSLCMSLCVSVCQILRKTEREKQTGRVPKWPTMWDVYNKIHIYIYIYIQYIYIYRYRYIMTVYIYIYIYTYTHIDLVNE